MQIRRIEPVQWLRAFAALIVVFHHARNPRPWLFDPLAGFGAGQAGVDIFFVISGFIMFASARDERWGDFIRRRLIRVVPMYWIATFIFWLMISHHLDSGELKDIAESLLFIPHYSPSFPGQVWPYLVQGWTLNYEMFFYLLFAVALMLKRLNLVLFTVIPGLVVLGWIVRPHDAALSTYTSPLLLEFLAGVAIARVHTRLTSPAWQALIPLSLLVLASTGSLQAYRVLAWGVPAAMLLVGALAFGQQRPTLNSRFVTRLGDASYSIYLFQVIAIAVAARAVQALTTYGPSQLLLMIAAGLALSAALGMVANRVVEKPLLRHLGGRKPLRRAEALAAP